MIVPPTASPIVSLFFSSRCTSSVGGKGRGTCPSTDGNKTANSTFKEFSPPTESPSILTSEARKYFSLSERLVSPDLLQEVKMKNF